jgi:hypothetical protein
MQGEVLVDENIELVQGVIKLTGDILKVFL